MVKDQMVLPVRGRQHHSHPRLNHQQTRQEVVVRVGLMVICRRTTPTRGLEELEVFTVVVVVAVLAALQQTSPPVVPEEMGGFVLSGERDVRFLRTQLRYLKI
tara:strand:+ start:1367 stop:1675 length:309 start_codon:yes stop_codon:yes gene_type:complete